MPVDPLNACDEKVYSNRITQGDRVIYTFDTQPSFIMILAAQFAVEDVSRYVQIPPPFPP